MSEPTRRSRWMIPVGAGFLGINLARHVMARGCEVTSLDIAPFDYPERSRIREVTGDIRKRADVDRALEGADIVCHTAAALPLYRPEDIMSTDLDGTRTVFEAARDAWDASARR